MREYETIYILKPDLPKDEVKKVEDKVDRVFKENNSTLVLKKDWGKRKLAYRIQKHPYGQYFYYNYHDEGQCVAPLEHILKIDENVIRFLTVKLSDDIDHAKQIKKITDVEAGGFVSDEGRPPRDRRFSGPRDQGSYGGSRDFSDNGGSELDSDE